jgi:hypothetical protein
VVVVEVGFAHQAHPMAAKVVMVRYLFGVGNDQHHSNQLQKIL